MKSSFLPFFHLTEFSADQFSKSTALIAKYVYTTYIVIKRYSHLCTIKARTFIITFGKEQPTYSFNQLMNSFNLKLHIIQWKLVRWSNISPRSTPHMPGVAWKGKKPFNIQQETLRGAQFGKGQGFDTRKSKADWGPQNTEERGKRRQEVVVTSTDL